MDGAIVGWKSGVWVFIEHNYHESYLHTCKRVIIFLIKMQCTVYIHKILRERELSVANDFEIIKSIQERTTFTNRFLRTGIFLKLYTLWVLYSDTRQKRCKLHYCHSPKKKPTLLSPQGHINYEAPITFLSLKRECAYHLLYSLELLKPKLPWKSWESFRAWEFCLWEKLII